MDLSKQQLLLVLVFSIILVGISWFMVTSNQDAVILPKKDRFRNSESVNQKVRPPDNDYQPLYEQYSVRQKGKPQNKLEQVD